MRKLSEQLEIFGVSEVARRLEIGAGRSRRTPSSIASN